MLKIAIAALIAATQTAPAVGTSADASVQVDVYQISNTQKRWLDDAKPADVARMAAGYKGARVRRLVVNEYDGEVNRRQDGNRVIGNPSSLTGLTARLDDARGPTPILTLTYSRLIARPDRKTKATRYTPFVQADRPLTRTVRVDHYEQHFYTMDFNDPANKVPMLVVVRRLPVAD